MPPESCCEVARTSEKVFTVSPLAKKKRSFTLEEALEKSGFGLYTWTLFFICTFSIVVVIQELFGISFILTSSSCDLNLTTDLKGVLGGVPMAGIVVSAHLWGYIADTKGRKKALIISMGGGAIFSFIASWSPNWIVLAIVKFISAAFVSATNAVAYTLFSECCPQSRRNKMVLLMSSGLMATQAFMSIVAYPTLSSSFEYPIEMLGISYKPWRLLCQLYAFFLTLFALLIYFFAWESPKFFLSQGNQTACVNVLKNLYRANGFEKKGEYEVEYVILTERSSAVDKDENMLVSMWNQTFPLFKGKLLKKTLTITYIVIVVYAVAPSFIMWFPIITDSYTKTMNSGTMEGPNFCQLFAAKNPNALGKAINETLAISEPVCNDKIEPMTFLFVFLFSIFSSIVNTVNSFIVRFFGKRNLVVFYFLLCGTASALLNFVFIVPLSLLTFCAMLLASVCMGICTTYTVEMYPTYLRGMAVCLTMMIGRGASIFSIQFVGKLLETTCEETFYGVAAVFFSGAIIAFLLPSDRSLVNENQFEAPPTKLRSDSIYSSQIVFPTSRNSSIKNDKIIEAFRTSKLSTSAGVVSERL